MFTCYINTWTRYNIGCSSIDVFNGVLHGIIPLADVSSWLQLFGFQLHNVVPGFPKPEVDSMEQTYEMMRTQSRTREWDPSKVGRDQVKRKHNSL